MFLKRANSISVVALVLFGSSCASDDLFAANKASLDAAAANLEAKDYRSCSINSTAMVANTEGEARKYRTQRFCAAYLGFQAHIRASFGGTATFLAGPRDSGGLLGSGGGADDFSIAHAVASARMIGYGKDWASDLTGQEALVPQSLINLGVDNAKINMDLCRLAILARLGFVLDANTVVTHQFQHRQKHAHHR